MRGDVVPPCGADLALWVGRGHELDVRDPPSISRMCMRDPLLISRMRPHW